MCKMLDWSREAHERLHEAGLRGGAARARLIDQLATQTCWPSAQEIHEELGRRGDRVGLASGHRALDTPVADGLAPRRDIGDGTARYLKEQNPAIQVIGAQPEEGAQIPGIRKWPEAYLPKIYEKQRVDRLEYVGQAEAEEMTRRLAREEGIFCGISSGGALAVALRISQQVENATIVFIVCDRGDRYLSTGVFPA